MDEVSGEPVRDRGFKARKRDDHTLTLIERLKESLADLTEVRQAEALTLIQERYELRVFNG